MYNDECFAVIKTANSEARVRNHEYIGAEHLLLGILNSANKACSILERLNVKEILLNRINEYTQNGPEIVTIGKLPNCPWAKIAFNLALDEKRRRITLDAYSERFVNTVDLLIGLIQTKEGLAYDIIAMTMFETVTPDSKVMNSQIEVLINKIRELSQDESKSEVDDSLSKEDLQKSDKPKTLFMPIQAYADHLYLKLLFEVRFYRAGGTFLQFQQLLSWVNCKEKARTLLDLLDVYSGKPDVCTFEDESLGKLFIDSVQIDADFQTKFNLVCRSLESDISQNALIAILALINPE